MTKESPEDEDEVINNIFEELGIGKYQVFSTIFIIIPTILNVMSNNTFVFTSRDTSYRCYVPECESNSSIYDQPWLTSAIPHENGVIDKCSRYKVLSNSSNNEFSDNTCNSVEFDNTTVETCKKWVFGSGDSIVKSFNIPCEDWKRSFTQSSNSAGLLVSLLISGILSDQYGRRTTMLTLKFLGGTMAIIQSFASSYWMFSIFEFLNAGIGAGGYSVAYVLLAESLSPSKRIYGCALMEIINSLSIAAVGLLAWATPTWRYLLRVINVPLLAVPLTVFIIPESLRWLYAKGKRKQCVRLYKKAAKINGSQVSEKHLSELRTLTQNLIVDKTQEHSKRETFFDMFKSTRILSRLLICSFCWFASILSYDGLLINSLNISPNEENDYLNFIVVTLVELPSILVYLLLLKYLSRRVGLCLAFVGAGSLCVAYGLSLEWNEYLRFTMYLLGKLLINTCLASMYVYSSEMFPTVFRSFSMNFCYVFGSIGGMLTPQVLLLNRIHVSLPMYIYGCTSILAAFSIMKLPETKGKKIPDSLEEAEKL